ncbi:unnamed protein product [Orchesella dallaii]|uniref:Uncharacterized protein n=1 Tax=Orchesella dallaii TaxID=48710 RepID=A0ABP1PM21_9HEXA
MFYYPIDDAIQTIDYLTSTFNYVCPIRQRKVLVKPIAQKFTQKSMALVKLSKSSYKAYTKCPSEFTHRRMLLHKKQANKSKLLDTQHQLEISIKEGNLWSALGRTYPLKEVITGNLCMDANLLNNHFVQISTKVDKTKPQVKPNGINPENKAFVVKDFTITDVKKAWKSIKNGNSNSDDPVGLQYWRPHFVIYMSTLFKTKSETMDNTLVVVITLVWNMFPYDATLLKASPTGLYLHNIPQSNLELVAETCQKTLKKFDNSRMKRNLAGGKAYLNGIPFYYEDYGKSGSCSMYELGLKTKEHTCSIKVLSKHYNFTVYNPGRGSKSTVGSVEAKLILSREFIQVEFLSRPVRFYQTQILPYSFYHEYKCLLFMSKEHGIDVLSILFPFDVPFGLTYILCFISVAICLTAVLRTVKLKDSGFSRPALLFLFPIKALLEQGDDPVVNMCQRSFTAGYFLIFSMFYPTSLIGNEYKGHLTSTMTSGFVPTVPDNVQTLVFNTSIPYYTTTVHSSNGQLYSTLTDIIMPEYIQQTQKLQEDESTLTKFLLKLTRNVKFISEYPSDIVFNMSKGLPVKTAYEGMQQFSKKFALFDQERRLGLFLSLVRKFLEKYWIIPIPMETKLFSIHPWMGMKNQFLKVFSRGLAGLVEGGIYDRWVKHSLKWEIMIVKNSMYAQLNVTKRESQFASVVLDNLESSKETVDHSSEIEIGMSSIWPAFVIFGVMHLISCMIFAIEHPVYNCKTTHIASFNEALPPSKSLIRNSRLCNIGIQIIFQKVIRKIRK